MRYVGRARPGSQQKVRFTQLAQEYTAFNGNGRFITLHHFDAA